MDNPAPSPSYPPFPRLPWDYHPALRPDRLRLCGRLLANARRDALALAREEPGDADTWSVGCRAYAFGRAPLRQVAEAGGAVSGVVFLAMRGEEGAAECAWEVPLDSPVAPRPDAVQLQLIGCEGRDGADVVAAPRGRIGAGRRPTSREPVTAARLS